MRWERCGGEEAVGETQNLPFQLSLCVQRRLTRSAGDSPAKVKARSLVAWMAGRRETNDLKPIDKGHRKDDCESPGRSASERIGGPESEKPRRPSPQERVKAAWRIAGWLMRHSTPAG